MAPTYELIASNTLTTSAASVTFSAIPATYTDLVLRISARGNDATRTFGSLTVRFNSDSSTNYSYRLLFGSGTSGASDNGANQTSSIDFYTNGDLATSNTFGNMEIYIPSYTASQNKPIGSFGVSETNATAARLGTTASLWRNTAVITSISIQDWLGTNLLSGSSFFLYGIKNS